MATVSFDRNIIVKNDKSCKILADVINFKKDTKIMSESKKINLNEVISRGKNALKNYCSHLQKS